MDILRSLLALVTWNTAFEDEPSGGDSPSYGDDEIRLLKAAFRERFTKGHTMNLGSGVAPADGWHRAGSAKVYYQASEPTTRPDGTTALTVDDNGRRWVRSSDNREYLYVHPDWVAVTALVGTDNTFSGDNIFSGSIPFANIETFSTPSGDESWTVPAGVYHIIVIIVGAGGGGGGATTDDGLGGGGTVFNGVTASGGLGGRRGNSAHTGRDSHNGLCAGNGGEGSNSSASEYIKAEDGMGGQVKFQAFNVTPGDVLAYTVGHGGYAESAGNGGDGQIIIIY